MQITLIRHLPTEWNVNTWLQGRQNIEILPITDRDQLEIVKNQNNLSRLQPFDLILASTLKRTQQTAQIYGMNVVILLIGEGTILKISNILNFTYSEARYFRNWLK